MNEDFTSYPQPIRMQREENKTERIVNRAQTILNNTRNQLIDLNVYKMNENDIQLADRIKKLKKYIKLVWPILSNVDCKQIDKFLSELSTLLHQQKQPLKRVFERRWKSLDIHSCTDIVDNIENIILNYKTQYDKTNLITRTQHANGRIEKIWVEFDVFENKSFGMRIHMDFTVSNLRSIKCFAGVYFYFSSGEILKDFNGFYKTWDGQVSTGKAFAAPYDNTLFTDFLIFMPYKELHMSNGLHNLIFQVHLYNYSTESFFAISNDYNFKYRVHD